MKKLLLLIAALLVAGLIYSDTQEARRAFRTFEQRAEQGDSEAQYRLATILETGWDSIPRDSVRALAMIKRSALSGFPPAMNYLGYLYGKGYGANGKTLVKANIDSARYWLRQSADLNDPRAMSNLAYLLLNADAVGKNSDEIARNRTEAVYYLDKAASAGAPTAMSMLGDLYRDGTGVQRDTLKALSLYEEALQSGLGDAEPRLITMMVRTWDRMPKAEQLKLGEQYLTTYAPGAGVLLLERAAQLPDSSEFIEEISLSARALYLLGEAYSRGIGVRVDSKKGLEYYVKAAMAGNDEAKKIVEDFRGLYPGDLKEVEESLSDFSKMLHID